MDEMQEPLFATVKLGDFVPRRITRCGQSDRWRTLKRLNGLFSVIYADTGRASIYPGLLRSLLLQVFHSVRSERMLMEQTRRFRHGPLSRA